MDTVAIMICLILLVFAGVACAMFRSMLKSAISLAVVSVLIALALYITGFTWAALIELSVCAGLVTIIFVITISMTQVERRDPEQAEKHYRSMSKLPFLLILVGVGLLAVLLLGNVDLALPAVTDPLPESIISNESAENITTTATAVSEQDFRDIFWNTRQADILGQMLLILAGAFAIVILFREEPKA